MKTHEHGRLHICGVVTGVLCVALSVPGLALERANVSEVLDKIRQADLARESQKYRPEVHLIYSLGIQGDCLLDAALMVTVRKDGRPDVLSSLTTFRPGAEMLMAEAREAVEKWCSEKDFPAYAAKNGRIYRESGFWIVESPLPVGEVKSEGVVKVDGYDAESFRRVWTRLANADDEVEVTFERELTRSETGALSKDARKGMMWTKDEDEMLDVVRSWVADCPELAVACPKLAILLKEHRVGAAPDSPGEAIQRGVPLGTLLKD